MSDITLFGLVDAIIDMEYFCYNFYKKLMEKFEDEPRLVELFDSLKDDEFDHIGVLKKIKKNLKDGIELSKEERKNVKGILNKIDRIKAVNKDFINSIDEVEEACCVLDDIEAEVMTDFSGLNAVNDIEGAKLLILQLEEHSNKVRFIK